jgi:menaquinone-dependent protoporphyrinogen oxidase
MCELPVFFATTEGQTRWIAEQFAAHARSLGMDSHAIAIDSDQAARFSWAGARAVVVAASVHAGRHQGEAEAFVRRNLPELNARPSMFVSVSLAINSKRPGEPDAARAIARVFPDHLGWKVDRVVCVAGRLAYTRYGPIKRFMMRHIAEKEGGPVDTSRDHELTDWAQVRAAASDIVQSIATPARRAAGA